MRVFSTGHPSANQAMPMPSTNKVYSEKISKKVEEEEEEAAAPVAVQTSFTIKLTKFDPSKKVAIIKAIKSLVEGMNLVQAKKFVESAPAVVRADIAKDEAEKIKEALVAVGGECEIE